MSLRLAALGDSITVGMGDPVPGGWRGFAPLLAASLHPADRVRLENFSEAGALAADVAGPQLEAARRWRPHIATVLVGVNDTLRGSFEIANTAAALAEAVSGLTDAGTLVITACLPEPGRLLRMPQALARPLARRIGAVNDVVHALSRRHGTLHAHLTGDPRIFDRRMWSVDRLHPSERGHRYLAGVYYDAIATAGWPVGVRPAPEPTNPAPTRLQQARWMSTKGVRWVADRSRDLVPQLAALAVTEWRLTRRGLAHHLDQRLAADVRAALAALPPIPALLPVPAMLPIPVVPAAPAAVPR
jgi:lysophospholipase L1-like esterase